MDEVMLDIGDDGAYASFCNPCTFCVPDGDMCCGCAAHKEYMSLLGIWVKFVNKRVLTNLQN